MKTITNRSINNSIKKNNEKDRKELELISQKFDLQYILSIINSKYANNFLNNIRRHRLKNYFYPDDFRKLPIPTITLEKQKSFIEKSSIMLSLNIQLQNKTNKFLNRIQDNLEVEKITTNLNNFYNFDFKIFKKELKKQKIILSLLQQDKWEDYFNDYKAQSLNIKQQIDKTDKEIDLMVYKLYDLTKDEIKIIEDSLN